MLPFWFFHPFTGDENKDIPENIQGALNRCWLNICGMLRSWLQHHVMKGNAEVRVSHGIFGWLLATSVPLWCGGRFRLLFRECLGYLCGAWMKDGCILCLEYVLLHFTSSQHEQRTGKISSVSQCGKFRVDVNQGYKLQHMSDFVLLVGWELWVGYVIFIGEAQIWVTLGQKPLSMLRCRMFVTLVSPSLFILSPCKDRPRCTVSCPSPAENIHFLFVPSL